MTGQQGDKEGKKNTAGDNATTPPNEEKSPEKAPPKSPGTPGTEADQDPPAAEIRGNFPTRTHNHQMSKTQLTLPKSRPQLQRQSQRRQVLARKKVQEHQEQLTTNRGEDSVYPTHQHSTLESSGTRKQWLKSNIARQGKPSMKGRCNIELMKPCDTVLNATHGNPGTATTYLKEPANRRQPSVRKKKKKQKPANSSTFKERLAGDEAFLDTLADFHMDKQPIVKQKSTKSPHMKAEPTFLGQLKTEMETLLNRQLTADEDVLAITISVLRQGICQTYLTSDSLTDSIEALEERRGTRNSGVNQEAEKDEMIVQLELNHRNMTRMEELLNQVRRHMSRAQEENISPCMYLDELPINQTQTSSRGSTNNPTKHSTRTHTRTSTRTGTPLRKTTSNTPGQTGGNPNPDGISDAITQLTKKMQITDPDRIVQQAPLLKLATAVNPTTPRKINRQGSTATPNRQGNPKTTPTGVTRGGKASSTTQAVPPIAAKKATTTTSANSSANSISAINNTTTQQVNTVQTASPQDSDSSAGRYYRNVEPRLFTAKQYDDVEMFLRNINRFMQRAKITNNDEKVDYLHKHLTTEVRIILNKTLTWEETCDYDSQVDFLRKWWPRPNDLEPLRDEFNRMKFNMTETVEECARRIQMQRSAGWPDESKISRRGMQSDYEKGVVEGLIRGLPKGLRWPGRGKLIHGDL